MGSGRITPGQSLNNAISARAWNRAQDAADVVLGKRLGQMNVSGAATDRAPSVLVVRNDTGDNLDRFGVVTIEGFYNFPSSTEEADAFFERFMSQRPVFRGSVPILSEADKLGIALEPIEAGQFGRVTVSGVVAFRLRVNSISHGYATVISLDTTQLQSATCGPVRILWANNLDWSEEDKDDRWAVGVM